MKQIEELKEFYAGKTVLVTGHTGFKGSWLTLWLLSLGAQVIGFSQPSDNPRNLFDLGGIEEKIQHSIGDIADIGGLRDIFTRYKPDLVFHLAAQPLVGKSYLDPLETYQTNIMGTVNLFECIRDAPYVQGVVNITSDKCYENNETIWSYRETDPLGGNDPYSASKACSEIITKAYRKSFFSNQGIPVASARAGNIIGGGDWNPNRLIPDCIDALENNKSIAIRNPNAVRPWQYVLDALYGYLLLMLNLVNSPETFSSPWNFGPSIYEHHTVQNIVSKIISIYGKGEYHLLDKAAQFHESLLLQLDSTKSLRFLSWKNILSTNTALRTTLDWYIESKANPKNMYQFSLNQIKTYEELLAKSE